MRFIQKTPLAVSGLALSLASLGNLLLPHGKAIQTMCGVLSAAILFLFCLKVILDFQSVKADLKTPVVLSSLPSSAMTVMILSVYVKPYIGAAAVSLWYLAIVCHVFILLVFAKRYVVKFNIQNVFPTWLVVCLGIVVVSYTGPEMNAEQLGKIIFYIGSAICLVLLPAIIYRVAKLGLPEPVRPTIAILTAPMNLFLIGYFSTFEEPIALLVYALLAASVMFFIFATIKVLSLLRTKFYPTFAAMTFPYVLTASAFKIANDFLISNGYGFFSLVPVISKWMAIMIVIYVLARYAIFFASERK